MSNAAARVRISRVRMKAGADIRILPRPRQSEIGQHMRAWVNIVLGDERPPDAYGAVAFWFDPAAPGRPEYSTGFLSRHDAIPLPVLSRLAAAYLADMSPVARGAERATQEMADETDGWEPEPTG